MAPFLEGTVSSCSTCPPRRLRVWSGPWARLGSAGPRCLSKAAEGFRRSIIMWGMSNFREPGRDGADKATRVGVGVGAWGGEAATADFCCGLTSSRSRKTWKQSAGGVHFH